MYCVTKTVSGKGVRDGVKCKVNGRGERGGDVMGDQLKHAIVQEKKS